MTAVSVPRPVPPAITIATPLLFTPWSQLNGLSGENNLNRKTGRPAFPISIATGPTENCLRYTAAPFWLYGVPEDTVRLSTATTIVAATIGLLYVRHQQEGQLDPRWEAALRTTHACLARGESLATTHDPVCIEAVAEVVRLMPDD
jgi:hypothetical protein